MHSTNLHKIFISCSLVALVARYPFWYPSTSKSFSTKHFVIKNEYRHFVRRRRKKNKNLRRERKNCVRTKRTNFRTRNTTRILYRIGQTTNMPFSPRLDCFAIVVLSFGFSFSFNFFARFCCFFYSVFSPFFLILSFPFG